VRDVFIALVVFGCLPYILVRPHIGIMMWSWLGIMNPHRMTYGFAYDFPFSMIVGVTTIISFIFSKDTKRFPVTPVTVVLILWIVWMTITNFWALNPTEAWPYWLRVVKIQVMIIVTLMVIRDKDKLNMLIWVVTMSLAFYGIKGGIFAIATGGAYMVQGPADSFITGNTEISLVLTMVLPLMRYLQLNTTSKWISLGLIAGMLLTSLAIIASYSRGAFVAIIFMGWFLWLKTTGGKKIVLAMVMLITAVGTLAFIPDKWFEKMATIKTYEQDASAQGRLDSWRFAINLANDRPITGGGFQVFTTEQFQKYAPRLETARDAHSIYFQVLGQQGYVGLIIFIVLGFLVWRAASSVIKTCGTNERLRWAKDLAAMIQVSLMGYAVGGAFLGLAYFDVPYLLVAFVVLLKLVVHESLKAETNPSTQSEVAPSKFSFGPRKKSEPIA
jgi:putative inorganic carbon (hco3(-)) transporter